MATKGEIMLDAVESYQYEVPSPEKRCRDARAAILGIQGARSLNRYLQSQGKAPLFDADVEARLLDWSRAEGVLAAWQMEEDLMLTDNRSPNSITDEEAEFLEATAQAGIACFNDQGNGGEIA